MSNGSAYGMIHRMSDRKIWNNHRNAAIIERKAEMKTDMYTFDSRIRYSETGIDGKLTLPAIVDYFQDSSIFHSESLGLGIEYLKEKQMVWVLSAWQIVIDRYPRLGEEVKVGTFPYGFKSFLGMRNFFMRAGEEEMIRANSVWTLMDTKKMIPVRPPEEMLAGYQLEEKLSMNYAPRKIAIPEGGERKSPFPVERHQLDSNLHVNNGQYILMAMDYLPEDFTIYQMRAEYKKSALLGDVIVPVVYPGEETVIVALCQEDEQPYAVVELQKRQE